jgi:K+-sensing histidine kinase KdpD
MTVDELSPGALRSVVKLLSSFHPLARHDLKTTINVVNGFAHMFSQMRETPNERADEVFQHLMRVIATHSKLLDLYLFRATEFDGRVGYRPIDVLTVLGGLHPETSIMADLRPDGEAEVVFPFHVVAGLLNEFVTNAERHGSPPLTIRCLVGDAQVVWEVEDSGKGIDSLSRTLPADLVPHLREGKRASGLRLASTVAQVTGGQLLLGPAATGGLLVTLSLPRLEHA